MIQSLRSSARNLFGNSLVAWLSLPCMFVLSANGAMCAPEHALRLEQTHFFFGTFVVDVMKNAVRIENTGRFKYVVVSRAPEWQVFIFRNDDKTYFSESFKQFVETGLVSDFLFRKREELIDVEKHNASPTHYFRQEAIISKARNRTLIFLPLQKFSAPQVSKIARATYKMPTGGGFPLVYSEEGDKVDFVVGQKMGITRRIFLSTHSITSLDAEPSLFTLPKNFTLAKSVREVVAGSDIRKESVDAQQLFESGREVPPKSP